jgi:RsiW-degrading membrane proteinase PrsW (M82 family)
MMEKSEQVSRKIVIRAMWRSSSRSDKVSLLFVLLAPIFVYVDAFHLQYEPPSKEFFVLAPFAFVGMIVAAWGMLYIIYKQTKRTLQQTDRQ